MFARPCTELAKEWRGSNARGWRFPSSDGAFVVKVTNEPRSRPERLLAAETQSTMLAEVELVGLKSSVNAGLGKSRRAHPIGPIRQRLQKTGNGARFIALLMKPIDKSLRVRRHKSLVQLRAGQLTRRRSERRLKHRCLP